MHQSKNGRRKIRCRPRQCRIDDVKSDLRNVCKINWKCVARDLTELKAVLREAKVNIGLLGWLWWQMLIYNSGRNNLLGPKACQTTAGLICTWPQTDVKYYRVSLEVTYARRPQSLLAFYAIIIHTNHLLPKFLTMLVWHRSFTLAGKPFLTGDWILYKNYSS